MEMAREFWVAIVVGIIPLLGCILWWWNDVRYALLVALRCWGQSSASKLPPGYMGVPFLGEMLHFLYYHKLFRRPDHYINVKRHKYGDGAGLYRTHLFGTPAIIAWTAEANRFIFKSESDFLLELPSPELVGVNSLIAVQGVSHKRIRSMVVNSINQPDALRTVAEMVQPRIVASLQSWANKGTVSASIETKKVTFESIGKYFCGFEPGPQLDALDKYFEGIVNGIRSYPLNIPGTAYHHALQCRKKATEIFREELEKRKKEGNIAGAKKDLLGKLMTLKDEEGKQLSDVEVLDNIVTLVIAGYGSTSLSIMWALYFLAQSPDVLQKLREEHMPLKKENGGYVTSDEIAKLPYTNKVVEETSRLANVAFLLFRTAAKDVDYQGYRIPKGWKVICWVRYVHTNPENWDDPMTFNPDRWNEQPKPGTYLVFGAGSRMCAGNRLARLQIAIFIHHLVTGYRWELVNPKAEMIYLPHLKPVDGVEINITKL